MLKGLMRFCREDSAIAGALAFTSGTVRDHQSRWKQGVHVRLRTSMNIYL